MAVGNPVFGMPSRTKFFLVTTDGVECISAPQSEQHVNALYGKTRSECHDLNLSQPVHAVPRYQQKQNMNAALQDKGLTEGVPKPNPQDDYRCQIAFTSKE